MRGIYLKNNFEKASSPVHTSVAPSAHRNQNDSEAQINVKGGAMAENEFKIGAQNNRECEPTQMRHKLSRGDSLKYKPKRYAQQLRQCLCHVNRGRHRATKNKTLPPPEGLPTWGKGGTKTREYKSWISS